MRFKQSTWPWNVLVKSNQDQGESFTEKLFKLILTRDCHIFIVNQGKMLLSIFFHINKKMIYQENQDT